MDIAVNYFGAHHYKLLHYAAELGVKHCVCTVPAASEIGSGYMKPWDLIPLKEMQIEVSEFGMDISVLEGIKFIDAAKLGTDEKDKCISYFCDLIRNMKELGIKTICYNWMPIFGWFRTRKSYHSRGGSVATAFFLEDLQNADNPGLIISKDELWSNLEYFMRKSCPWLRNAVLIWHCILMILL